MKIQINRCLDLRYKSKNNTFPVCIRLYYNRRYDYVKTGVLITETEYEDLFSSKIKPSLKELLKAINQLEGIVSAYINSCTVYDIGSIRSQVLNFNNGDLIHKVKPNFNLSNVFDWFDKKIKTCKTNKQFGSAESYKSTKNVYKDHLKMPAIEFRFFTVERLKELETSLMAKRHIEISTVGKHARNLRSIFKMALNDSIVSNNDYPFGRYKYMIPEVTKAKKSLSRKALKDILEYQPKNYYESRAIAYFVFSYFANGMNLKDMALLKYKDWKNDIIFFLQKKTKNTTSKLRIIRVIVNEEMKAIIKEFGNLPDSADTFIFPIIEPCMEEQLVNTKVQTRNKSINNTLKLISEKIGSDRIVTLGMARHTFANALKQEGISINFIQESLGHGSASTTEHYLSSFEDAISTEHVQKLKNYFNK